jgi:hypothetical protein
MYGHVSRIGKIRNTYMILVWKPLKGRHHWLGIGTSGGVL